MGDASIRYLAVVRVRDNTPIASYCVRPSQDQPKSFFDDRVRRALASVNLVQHPRLSIMDRTVGDIHYDAGKGYFFVIVSHPQFNRRDAFRCIQDMSRDFIQEFGHKLRNAGYETLSWTSRELLSAHASKYNVTEQDLERRNTFSTPSRGEFGWPSSAFGRRNTELASTGYYPQGDRLNREVLMKLLAKGKGKLPQFPFRNSRS